MKLPFFGRDDEDEDYGPQEEEEEEVEGDGLLGRFTAILSPARLLRWRPGEKLNANDRPPEEPEPPSLEGLTAVSLPEDGSPLSVDVVVSESGDHAGEPETPAGAAPSSSDQAPGDQGADEGPGDPSGDLSGDPLGEPTGPLSAASDEASPSAAEDDEDDEDDEDEDEDGGGGEGEGGSVLDGLMDLFEDSYESDSNVRELAVSLEELDIQDLARQCQELARDLKQRKPAA